MKPLSHFSQQPRALRGEQSPLGLHLEHPVTDYYYHAPGGDLRAANDRLKLSPPLLAPSFRDLSNDFLAREMRRNYVAEAFFFAIIVGVSAWPIVSMMRALSQLMK